MSKEYRKEVEKLFDAAVDNVEIEEGIYRKELLLWGDDVDNLITQLCQLRPKNQVVIAEGEIENLRVIDEFDKPVTFEIAFAELNCFNEELLNEKLDKKKKIKVIIILEEE